MACGGCRGSQASRKPPCGSAKVFGLIGGMTGIEGALGEGPKRRTYPQIVNPAETAVRRAVVSGLFTAFRFHIPSSECDRPLLRKPTGQTLVAVVFNSAIGVWQRSETSSRRWRARVIANNPHDRLTHTHSQ